MQLTQLEQKQLVAQAAVDYVEDGMLVGLGFGSTFLLALDVLAEKYKNGLKIEACVPATQKTAIRARELGLPVFDDPNDIEKLDIAIDGADEATPQLDLIKGGGGALTREKIIIAMSERVIILGDQSKFVKKLGAFPLPVEVIPFGYKQTIKHISEYNPQNIQLRMLNQNPFKTDTGNYILDCHFGQIDNPRALHDHLNAIPGVVENGLFCGLCDLLIIALENGEITEHFAL